MLHAVLLVVCSLSSSSSRPLFVLYSGAACAYPDTPHLFSAVHYVCFAPSSSSTVSALMLLIYYFDSSERYKT
eukprot:jgi/Botrbrau1/3908/Bobra.0183s0129.1